MANNQNNNIYLKQMFAPISKDVSEEHSCFWCSGLIALITTLISSAHESRSSRQEASRKCSTEFFAFSFITSCQNKQVTRSLQVLFLCQNCTDSANSAFLKMLQNWYPSGGLRHVEQSHMGSNSSQTQCFIDVFKINLSRGRIWNAAR